MDNKLGTYKVHSDTVVKMMTVYVRADGTFYVMSPAGFRITVTPLTDKSYRTTPQKRP